MRRQKCRHFAAINGGKAVFRAKTDPIRSQRTQSFAQSFVSYRDIKSGQSAGSLALDSSWTVGQGIGRYFTTAQFQPVRCQFRPDRQVSPMVTETTSRAQFVEASFQLPKRHTPHWPGDSTCTALYCGYPDALFQRFPEGRRAIDRSAAAW